MPSHNDPADLPKHRIEFTGKSRANRTIRSSRTIKPPKWFFGWIGYLLMCVLGMATGAAGLFALNWLAITHSDDVGSPMGAVLWLLLSLVVGSFIGGIAGLVVWAIICAKTHSDER